MKPVYATTIIVVAISVAASGSLFYWYELRPASIRRECSWVKVIDKAEPAQPAITKEEAGESKIKYDQCKKENEQRTGWNQFNGIFECEGILKHSRDAIPAKPEGEWYRQAEEKEYKLCLHQKGLQ